MPRTVGEITAPWLTAILRENGILKETAVTVVAAEPLGVGTGFLGQLARLRLTYDRPDANAPSTLVAKLPSLDAGGRQVSQLFQFYDREARFYRELAGAMPLRVPRCYASLADADAGDYLLLLEDFGHWPIGDDASGCSAVEAEVAIRTLARLHRAFWESPALERLDWVPMVNAPVHHLTEPAYAGSLEPFLKNFGDALSPRMRGITERMAGRIVPLLDAGSRMPRTLIHGDYRLDNLFFPGREVAVIDWQIACRGQGAFDVAYFLSGCLEPAVRRTEEMRLLRLWHDLVTDGSAIAYPFDRALTDYRRSVLYCNVYTVIAIGSLDATNERGMAVFTGWLRRRSAAIEDLDAGELLPE
jgi:aminoglycoside/choline kinase family phosphotransferase